MLCKPPYLETPTKIGDQFEFESKIYTVTSIDPKYNDENALVIHCKRGRPRHVSGFVWVPAVLGFGNRIVSEARVIKRWEELITTINEMYSN